MSVYEDLIGWVCPGQDDSLVWGPLFAHMYVVRERTCGPHSVFGGPLGGTALLAMRGLAVSDCAGVRKR